MYSAPKNPYNCFSEDEAELERYAAFEKAEEDRLIALPKEEGEKLRAEYYTKHYDTIENDYIEQGSHVTNEILWTWDSLNKAILKRRELDGEVTIALRPLAIVDPSQKFSFHYKGQLYRIGIPHVMSLKLVTPDVNKLLEKQIQEYFGITNPIVFDKLPQVKNELMKGVELNNAMLIRPLNERELFTTDAIENSLDSIKTSSLICEVDHQTGASDFWNVLLKITYGLFFPKDLLKRIEFNHSFFGKMLNKFTHFLDKRSKTKYVRNYHLVGYLGIKCLAHEIETASALIALDLAKLNSIGALVGNLTKQQIVALADTVGDGKLRYIVLCYPLVKHQLATSLSKFCEYAIDEGMDTDKIKSVSEDNPNIVDIFPSYNWDRETKKRG